jgi:hypothetical protein
MIDPNGLAGAREMLVGVRGPGIAPGEELVLCVPAPIERIVSKICACGLLASSSWIEKSVTMPLETNWLFTYSRTNSTFSLWVSSTGSPSSISRASCASLRFSVASTVFHKICRSYTHAGASCGAKISECSTPCLRE